MQIYNVRPPQPWGSSCYQTSAQFLRYSDGATRAAPAQPSPACEAVSQSCSQILPQQCLSRLGAGAIPTPGSAQPSPCDEYFDQYRACLADVVSTCE